MKRDSHLHCFIILLIIILSACQPVNAAERVPTVEQPSRTAPSIAVPTLTPKATIILPASNPTLAPSRAPTQTDLPPSPTLTASATEIPEITLLFTGVIVPARCVQAALDANGNPDYPYEEVHEVISQADLAIGTFNATMSHRVSHTGCVWTYQLVGSPQNADAMQRAGFDVMSVATNHIKDCGLMKSWCNETFFDTLDNLRRVGIQAVGAGKDLREALQPVVINVQGVRFAFVSLGDSKMDESVFATDDNPGIARLTQENIAAAIAAAKDAADVVIALPHWGSEDNFIPNWNQLTQAQQLVAAGANLIVGNHTHVVQAITEIDSVPVFYGLGNFVFDQWLRDHRQGVILLVKFQGTRYIGYELIPTHVDQDGRVHIADEVEAAEILQNIERASQAIR